MNNKLFVASLPWGVDDQELKDLFSKVGNVLSATVIINRDTGKSKGFGFVEMSTDQEAQSAIQQLHGANYNGRKLVVNIAKPQEARPIRYSQNTDRERRSIGGNK